MKRVFFVDIGSGAKRFDEAQLPMTVGGAGADIVLGQVPANSVIAHIALSSGHAYIQAGKGAPELFHNHELINESAWLKSGDRVELGDWVLDWDVKGDQVFVKIRHSSDQSELQPPAAPPPEIEEEAVTEIIPIVTNSMSAKKRSRLRTLLIALFSLLGLMALFVLLATPLTISISPEPASESISGFPPAVSFGSRLLMVPGTYTVHATREGYQELEQSFEVSSNGFQKFDFELMELPGRLQITVDPVVPVRVFVAGEEAFTDTDDVFLLERGLQQLSIETERYLVETVELDVAGYGELQQLNIPLSPAWANVQLDSNPTGAQVMVDGEILGTTPLLAEIIQGPREIEWSLPGFKAARRQETFVAGTSPVLDIVELVPNDGTLVLDSRPQGATVSINGGFYGSTPVTLVLPSGITQKIQLSKPGYKDAEKSLSLQPDEEKRLTIDIPTEYGIVFASSRPADASLKVDGKPSGNGTQRLRLSTRQHVLEFSKPGYLPQTVKVSPRTATSQKVDVTLKTLAQAKEEARPNVFTTAGGQEMRLLEPSGSFKMGASRREAGRRANESQRLVEITRPYYLSSKEVSNGEYRLFSKNHNSGSAEGVSINGDQYPVINVSWDDAVRYCNWLSEKHKLTPAYIEADGHMKMNPASKTGYRLPSEAEWAYAARIEERSASARYPWGEGYPPTTKAGNFADAQIADTLANVVSGYNDGYRGSAPVGSFTAQPAGFHDLGGNVAEWTNDYYAVYPGQAGTLVKDPTGPASGDHHVVRGSSWRDGSITELRLSYRDYSRGPRDNLGFRIARYADE